MRNVVALFALLLCMTMTVAQESPNYELSGYTIASGSATALDSPEFQITLALVGSSATGDMLQGPSFGVDVGFVTTYAPPGEVQDVRFEDQQTLSWSAEGSVGTYELYRGTVQHAPPDYGSCFESQISLPETTDPESPPAGNTFFYLVTASNRLDEEGTKGQDSLGRDRPNTAPCP